MRRFIARWGDRAIRRLRHWIAESQEVRGLPVVVENGRPDIQTSLVIQRLDEALGLIEQYQPWRFRHLRRDLKRIYVMRYPCRGAYFAQQRTCLTELTFLGLGEFSAAQIAASILHEAMHARIHRRGVQSMDAARMERICRRAEIDFGRALPTELGAPVLERAEQIIALSDQEVAFPIDWTEAHLRKDLAEIEALQLPGWLTRRLIGLRRRQARDSEAR